MTSAGQRTATLIVLSLTQFLIALDYSVIYVALPSIAAELDLSAAATPWIVSAYAVPFAGFLVLGGRWADRIGAARLYLLAIGLFGVASVVGGLADDGGTLLAARAAQGLGAAMLQPAVLALLGTTFPAGPSRRRALVVWGSVGAAGLAAGAIVGGLLTALSWRLTFGVNLPFVLLLALGAARWFTLERNADLGVGERVPALAATLGTGAALTLALGLTTAADRGWGATATIGSLLASALLIAAFVGNERRSPNALVAPSLRRTRSLRVGLIATALYMASVGSEFYLVTLLVQSERGYSPVQAGLAFLPLALLITVGNTLAGRLLQRVSAPTVLMAGFMTAAVGLGWLVPTLDGSSYAGHLLPGLLLSGLGHGLIYTAMFVIGTSDVPAHQQGTAGALLTTTQYLSGALTLAVLTLVLGDSAGAGDLRAAFGVITGAAVAGVVLAAVARRPTRGPIRERPALVDRPWSSLPVDAAHRARCAATAIDPAPGRLGHR